MENKHLLLEGGWQLWRHVWLRSAGFPARWVTRLETAEASRRSDRLFEAEESLKKGQNSLLSALRNAGRAGDRAGKKNAVRLQKRVQRRESIAAESVDSEATELLKAYEEALRLVNERVAGLRQTHKNDCARARSALLDLGRNPKIREAITWQNRAALDRGVAALLRAPVDQADSATRQNEALLANYVQRYCTKNETIGFFGPVAWAAIDPRAAGVSCVVGPDLVRARAAHFEHWAIDLFSESLDELRPQFAPRLSPTLRVDQGALLSASGKKIEIDEDVLELLSRCDGKSRAVDLAAGDESALAVLHDLAEQKVLIWDAGVPVCDVRAERSLRNTIEAASPGPARSAALQSLEQLERDLSEIGRAAGAPEKLAGAIEQFERDFERMTSSAARRRAGSIYAGRTLFYEDTCRDVDCVIGPDVIARFAPALVLLLQSSRWFSYQIALGYLSIMRAEYSKLCLERANAQVDFVSFWSAIIESFSNVDGCPALVQRVADEARARWREILSPDPRVQRQDVPSKAIAERVRDSFAAPHAGWPLARYHSPDLMIAASSREAISRGEMMPVIGELHATINSLFQIGALSQHDRPAALFEDSEAELPGPMVHFTPSKEQTTRVSYLPLRRDAVWVLTGASQPPPGSATIPISELLVRERDDKLYVASRDGELEIHVLACLQQHLSNISVPYFSLLPPLEHCPRLSIDGVVIERERWHLSEEYLGFAALETPLERFIAARRLMRRWGMPRFVFAKTPEERKPSFVDFDSAVLVEAWCRLLRKARSVTISEMLPEMGGLWLEDAAGERYTAELRVPVLDPAPWSEL